MYTEKEIEAAKTHYENYHAAFTDAFTDRNLTAYVSRETDPDGNVLSFCLGLEDENGNAVTGCDEHYG